MDKIESYFYPLWIEAVKQGQTLLGFHEWIDGQNRL